MHFVQEQEKHQQKQKTKKKKKKKNKKKKKKAFNFLKLALTTSGAAILFCLVAMQRSVSDSESAPNTVTKRHKALFGNVPLRTEALCNARLMQLIPGSNKNLPDTPYIDMNQSKKIMYIEE